MGSQRGQCSKGDNCSIRHDFNKRAKKTQPNLSLSSSTRQNVRSASSGKMARLPCKENLKGICTNSFCEKWHPPECLFYKFESGADLGKSALMLIARLKNSLAKGFERNGDTSAVAIC